MEIPIWGGGEVEKPEFCKGYPAGWGGMGPPTKIPPSGSWEH